MSSLDPTRFTRVQQPKQFFRFVFFVTNRLQIFSYRRHLFGLSWFPRDIPNTGKLGAMFPRHTPTRCLCFVCLSFEPCHIRFIYDSEVICHDIAIGHREFDAGSQMSSTNRDRFIKDVLIQFDLRHMSLCFGFSLRSNRANHLNVRSAIKCVTL